MPTEPSPLPAPDGRSAAQTFFSEFLWFGIKQGWACIFGGLMLGAVIATAIWYPENAAIARYDFLFGYALAVQVGLVLFKLESPREFLVVIVFHLLATGMEIFKTSAAIGSWSYPEESVLRIGGVPLFAGFMYSAVGSYMARAWRVFHFRFEKFPPLWLAALLAALSYINFFTHHYIVDIRVPLLLMIGFAYLRTRIYYRPEKKERHMNLLIGFVLVSFFIYLAENIGTASKVWLYPNQKSGWQIVGLGKFAAWFLLMQLSFVLIYAMRQVEAKVRPREET